MCQHGWDSPSGRSPFPSMPHHDDFLLILPIQVRQRLLWSEPSSSSGFPGNLAHVATVSSSQQNVRAGLDPFSGIFPKNKVHALPAEPAAWSPGSGRSSACFVSARTGLGEEEGVGEHQCSLTFIERVCQYAQREARPH